jgi:small-conductance mechanosensitive channel
VQFKVRCWIENYVGTRISENRLNTAIYKALISAGISMAIGTSYVTIHFVDSENESIIFRQGKDLKKR